MAATTVARHVAPQTRGVTAFPGLFFVGLPWLHTAKSGLIYGLAEDARYVADRIANRIDARDSHVRPALRQSALAEPKPIMTADRTNPVSLIG